MSYRQDPVYRAVQWLRSKERLTATSKSFAAVLIEAWDEWQTESPRSVTVRLRLVNYKPFERARVVVEVCATPKRESPTKQRVLLFVQILADGACDPTQSPGGVPCLRVPERGLTAWTLPNAPGLHDLWELQDLTSFRQLIACAPELAGSESLDGIPTLVRYVPHKRAILVWDRPTSGKRYYLKMIDGPDAAAAALNQRELHAWAMHGSLSFAVPRPVHYSPRLGTMIMTEVPGRRLTELMPACQPAPFVEVGEALASLHRLPTVPTKLWQPEQEWADLHRHMRGVKRALPNLAGRLDAFLERLGPALGIADSARVPIHGNLFGDQILYDGRARPGSRVGMVDWDPWCSGDAHFDIGRLLAHLIYVARLRGRSRTEVLACAEALLRGYGEGSGVGLDRERLWRHVAAALLMRVKISSFRPLRPGWPRHVEFMLAEAERVLCEGLDAPELVPASPLPESVMELVAA